MKCERCDAEVGAQTVCPDGPLRCIINLRARVEELRAVGNKLLPFLWETNFDEEIETEYEQAVVDLRDALVERTGGGKA